jgi:hypothetical protein
MANPFRNLIQSGARTRLSLDGVKVALAMNCNYGERIEHAPVKPLDQFEAAENVPIDYDASFSAQMCRVIGNSVKNRDGIVIFPRLRDILTRGEMTGTVEDPTTGILLATIQRVKCVSYQIQTGARGIVLTDLEFNCIAILDESEVS